MRILVGLFLMGLMALPAVGGEAVTEVRVPGKVFRAIEAAVGELRKKGLEVDRYQILLTQSGTSIVVFFQDPDRATGQRGGSPNMLEFQVEMDASTLAVTKTQFVR